MKSGVSLSNDGCLNRKGMLSFNYGVIVYEVVASHTYLRGEVVCMSTYESISLMIAFGMLILTLLTYIDRNNKRK